MSWLSRRRDARSEPPEAALAGLAPLAHGERVLAAAPSGSWWLVATNHRFACVEPGGERRWLRPWHEVDAASWSREAGALTVTFVDGGRPVELPLGHEETFLRVLRERVQASVVVAADLPLERPRKARAVIRQDLATGALMEQVVLGRGTRPGPYIDAAAQAAFVQLRDDTGLPPRSSPPPATG